MLTFILVKSLSHIPRGTLLTGYCNPVYFIARPLINIQQRKNLQLITYAGEGKI